MKRNHFQYNSFGNMNILNVYNFKCNFSTLNVFTFFLKMS